MMKKAVQLFKHKAFDLRWALLSGILVGTSYIPCPPWALLFCYVPLWLSVSSGKNPRSLKQAFWSGWVTQFVLTAIGFHWIAYTAHEFGAMPWIISYSALLLFCAFMHLYIPAATTLGAWLQRRFQLSQIQTLFTIALLHALLERVWPVIFDWNLGYTLLGAHIPAFQWADLIGFAGLSAVILIINAWIGAIWLQLSNRRQALTQIVVLVAVLIFLVIGGTFHKAPWDHFDKEFKATIVQANIGNSDKIQAERGRGAQEFITRKFTAMTKEAFTKFPDTDIFVWPETAFPDYLDQRLLGRKHTQILAESLMGLDRPILTGAYSRSPVMDPHRDEATFNALFLVDAHGNNLSAPYLKTNLLAFGEYLPFSERFPILLKWLPFISNFGRGIGPQAMTWNKGTEQIHLGGQICYEGLDAGFSRGLSLKGSDVLVNVTNDSWFGRPFEPLQHMYMTLARGIETRRPLVRSTNTGISTVMWANGDLQQISPLHEEWSGQFTVKYRQDAPQTFYVRWGHLDWLILLLSLAGLVLSGALHARSRRP